MSDTAPLLVVVRDLMFSSKIIAEARAQGIDVKIVRDPAKLAAEPGKRLLADLSQPGVIDAVAAWKNATSGEVIGFVSHVDAQTIAQARQSGIDQILARSQFTAQLAEIVRQG
jgi:hypothetical protein